MWTPTHVQVTSKSNLRLYHGDILHISLYPRDIFIPTFAIPPGNLIVFGAAPEEVHRARNLIPKGKNGTNDAYITIALGKEKYQTSVKEKSEGPEWHEECDLPIPSMESDLVLNCFHRNLLGLDEFLGHVSIPLEQFKIYERPKSRWYALRNKPGNTKKEKYRGEIEVRVLFTVKNLPTNDRRMSLQTATLGDKIHSKMEKRKSKQDMSSDCSDSPSLTPKHDLLKLSKSSPGKLEKRRRSVSHEVLATTPSFEIASSIHHVPHSPSTDADNSSIDSRDSASASSSTPSKASCNSPPKKHKAPPKPPRTVAKDKSSSDSDDKLTRSNTDLTNDFSLTKLQGSPKQYRSRDNIADCETNTPENNHIKTPSESMSKSTEQTVKDTSDKASSSEHSLESRSDNLDRSGEDEDYFSRTNSFRQAIQRGSIRKSGSRKGRAQGDAQQSPLLTGIRRSYNQSDSNLSIDTLPEETSTPVSTPTGATQPFTGLTEETPRNNSSNKDNVHDNVFTPTTAETSLKTAKSSNTVYNPAEDSSPRLRTKQSKQDPSRRHTLGMREMTRFSSHEMHETFESTKHSGNEDKAQSLPNEIMDQFKSLDREDLIKLILSQKKEMEGKNKYSKDLEDYIDNLLVRVIEVQPRILQTPFPSPYISAHHQRAQTISSGVRIGVNNDPGIVGHRAEQVGQQHPNYPPPAYYSSSAVVETQNNNRNVIVVQQQQQGVKQQNSYNNRSRMSPPKLIKAGQNNTKKDKKSSNPFKKLLKN